MSYKIDVVNVDGKKISDRVLSDVIFNEDNINKTLIHEFVIMQLANKRQAIAHVKTRWEVQTSGRKLFRQKWTGKARVWDAGSPIRRWWWKSFWPRNERNFSKDMNRKARRKALLWALSLKAKEDQILCLDSFSFDEIKTKNALSVLLNNNLVNEKILLVLNREDDIAAKSFRNMPNVKYVISDYLNPYDILTHSKLMFLSNSLDYIEDSAK